MGLGTRTFYSSLFILLCSFFLNGSELRAEPPSIADRIAITCNRELEIAGGGKPAAGWARASYATVLPASEVEHALRWVDKYGRLDLPMIETAGAAGNAPKITSAHNARELFYELDARGDHYSNLVLVTTYPHFFPDAQVRGKLARTILTDAFAQPHSDKLQDQVVGALAVLSREGTILDGKILDRAGAWAATLPNTFAEVRADLAANHQSKSATPEESLKFVEALFKDTLQRRPGFAFFIDHSHRVADTLIQLKQNGSPIAADSRDPALSDRNLWIAAFTHDVGKTDWPVDLIIKNSRLGATDFAALKEKFDVAKARGKATDAQWAAISELNTQVSEHRPLVTVTAAHSATIQELVRNGVISEAEGQLLVASKIMPSARERWLFDQHVGGYRTLLMLGSNDLGAKLAQLHHEWLNGQGYLFNLTSASLSPTNPEYWLIRAMTVADVFDAMTSARPNSPHPMTPAQAIALMRDPQSWGPRLDQDIVASLAKVKGVELP